MDGIFIPPSDDEFRQWAYDPDSDGPVYGGRRRFQDWDLMVTDLDRGRLFVELADSNARERMFFLRCLYLLVYDTVRVKNEDELTRLGYLFHRVCEWTSKADVVRWTERSRALIERSRLPDFSLDKEAPYEDWAHGYLADR